MLDFAWIASPWCQSPVSGVTSRVPSFPLYSSICLFSNFTHFLHLQHLSSSQWLHHFLSRSPLSRATSFWWTLLLGFCPWFSQSIQAGFMCIDTMYDQFPKCCFWFMYLHCLKDSGKDTWFVIIYKVYSKPRLCDF